MCELKVQGRVGQSSLHLYVLGVTVNIVHACLHGRLGAMGEVRSCPSQSNWHSRSAQLFWAKLQRIGRSRCGAMGSPDAF